jgi:allophanate hydrolase
VVPACRSLDCVSTFGRTVHDAALTADLAAGFDALDPRSQRALDPAPLEGPVRVGLPSPRALGFHGHPDRAAGYADAVALVLDAVPGEAVGIDLAPFLAAGELLYGGAFLAERYAAVGHHLEADSDDLDPVVRSIIRTAAEIPAWELARDLHRLAELRRATEATWTEVDVLVLPTVPRIVTRGEVADDPIGPNASLGTFTTFVNLLGLCAVTIPVGPGAVDGPPYSLSVIGPPWTDHLVASVARLVTEQVATGTPASLRAG